MNRVIRVFCEPIDFDDVLVDVIAPIVAAHHLDGTYVTRHWKQGEHWRLHVDAASSATQDMVSALSLALRRYRSVPTRPVHIADDVSLAVQERRAELENDTGPFVPVQGPGTVDVIDEPDRTAQQGGPGGSRQIAEFYRTTNASVEEISRLVRAGASRQSVALDLMVTTAHCFSGIGLARGFVSFRSHADAFLSWWPEAAGSRAVWESKSVSHGAAIGHRIGALIERLDAGSGIPAHVENWLETAGPFFTIAGRRLARGDFTVDPPWAAAARAGEGLPELGTSPFHSRAGTLPGHVDTVWFAQYRLALNYLYLHLTRIGLSPYDRFMLCHLAADACERVYRTRAHDVRFPQEGEGIRIPDVIELREDQAS
ncbi:lantibiotic dehydratase C-terminal domain-containing protein [Curtobacterium sp. HSID17257]|uniref:lantibiotic dehydratase C-terminal domain-containing protein n=1 Tax=Curtobacterium sp. HSID17257 TaxID=2419510 RepID=UPI000F86D7F3|nr:lantibiotic dehydratase C-terminal domain-containing protein [Curtobacterium sp. HSID17257]RUQ10130.1 hypothetical protein D8M35_00530 [Curtobacterium sp. HSID17257]